MSKEDLLRNAGFKWHAMRCIWISTDARKIFSSEVVDDKSDAWLQNRLGAAVPNHEFWFFFTSPPDEAVLREILNELGMSSLKPVAAN